jgi:hypothetical protein
MVDEIGNLISTLFQRQKSNVNPICIFNPFSTLRLSNVWVIISNVDSTLNKRHFSRWGIYCMIAAIYARNESTRGILKSNMGAK